MASALVLTGCAKQPPVHSLVTPPTVTASAADTAATPAQGALFMEGERQATPPQQGVDNRAEQVQQCRKELDAMRMYSDASYTAYAAEFQKIGAQTNKYLQIKDTLGADINDLVMPRYQFQIRELCFRIKTRLAQLIIRQAG